MAEVTGQRIVNFVETTNPSNQDYFATDNASNGNRKISYVILSDKVLDKLLTKTFSLDGSNKTVLDALAELFLADDTLNARIDSIITPSGAPSLDELIDIRTNFLGITYGSAGEAVRQSDMLLSGYENAQADVVTGMKLVDPSTIPEQFDTYSIDIGSFKGGTLALTFNYSHGLPSNGQNLAYLESMWGIKVSNTQTPTTSGGTAIPSGLHDTWDNTGTYSAYRYLKSDHIIYRWVCSLPIPDDVAYNYLWVSVPNEKYWDQSWSGGTTFLRQPNLGGYGDLPSTSYTFADPNNDGNIVIS